MTTNWIKEFDKIFTKNMSIDDEPFQGMYLKLHLIPALKSFITTLLEKQREEDFNLVLKILPNYTYTGDPQVDDACEMVQDEYKRTLIANIKNLIKCHDKTS